MVSSQEWQVISRDPDLVRRGYLPWKTLVLDHRHADVSAWTLTLPAIPSVLDKIGPGWGVILLRWGQELLSGPIEDDGPRSWTAASDGGPGTITVTGADDLVIVANEIAYPNPALNATGQSGSTYQDVQTSHAAETVIKHYVAANVGSTRATARGDASAPLARTVTVATDQGRGDTVSFTARFNGLLDIIQTISNAGSNLGAEVLQSGSTLVFDVYEPRDLTSRMRFSREAGTLTTIDSTVSMPTLTHAVVLGAGTGAAQVVTEVDDSVSAQSWRMIVRQAVDSSSTSDAATMTQAGQAALTAGRRQYARNVTIVETPQVRYPQTVRRGDIVTIVDPTRPGTVITDVISSVHIEADASAGTRLIQFNVGTTTQTASANDLTNQLTIVKRKINELQKRTP
jgi:hypothetical protein